jgi:hypothetical protein
LKLNLEILMQIYFMFSKKRLHKTVQNVALQGISDLWFILQVDVKHNFFDMNTLNFRIFTQLLYHITPIVTSITLLYNQYLRNA